ncbi:MAG: hypothetical protein E7295_08080 [Lachnospiraceae bacterium]|jgi:hypothetical protein|nr:hypothetical protein [Lachnospiraceae bacterium]
MKIWKLSALLNEYVVLEGIKDYSLEEIRSFDGRRKSTEWDPLIVKRSIDSAKRELSDFPGFILTPVFSERALRFLLDLIKDDVEVLKLNFDEGNYYAINVISVLDVLDYQKAKYKTFRDGKKIMWIEKYEFKMCKDLESSHIFKLIDEKRGDPFVSDEFKKIVEKNELTGFHFELAWDSEECNEIEKNKSCEGHEKDMEDDCFSYVGDLDVDIMDEIEQTILYAQKVFRVHETKDGRKLAKQIFSITEKILNCGKYPKEYDDLDDVAIALGCLFGQALVKGLGWKWKEVGESKEDAMYCVVSPDENWVNPCMVFMQKILNGENIGADGRNDNTVMLLWNLAEQCMKNPPKNKLTILW